MLELNRTNQWLNQIINIDWIEGLKQLDDESIDVCMTSPPYWGLRDYGTATWIESNNPNCDHKVGRDTRTLTEKSKLQMGSIGSYGDEAIKNGHRCPKCNALRIDLQLGLESHPQEWINKMVEGLAILKKKLKKTGSLWLNVGDTYFASGHGAGGDITNSKQVWTFTEKERKNCKHCEKEFEGWKFQHFCSGACAGVDNTPQSIKGRGWLQAKQLMLMPSRLAIALQDNGWILRNDVIWHKVNPMPSSVKDRLNTTFEHVFHFVKSKKYYYDLDAIREPHKSGIALLKEEYEESKLDSWHNHELDDTMGQHQGINTPQELHYHPSGKNPGDVILTKRELLLETGMVRNGGEGSTLGQPNKWNESGKNPGDVYECIPMYTDVDFWQITTQPFPEAHFATYPVKLCEKPIKATLPKEICVKCGFIREKITKVDYEWQTKSKTIGDKQSLRQEEFGTYIIPGHATATHSTIGWTNCKCPDKVPECQSCSSLDYPYHDICCDTGIISDWKNIDKWKAGVICDPFAGAGTTFVAMYEYNPTAKFIGFELNQKYIDIAMQRLKPHMEQTRLSEIIN